MYIENSQLVIVARQNGNKYTSTRIITQRKKSFTHGKIAFRLKLPYGIGIWPAAWMLGESIASVGWPACGEIDVMEMVGGDKDQQDSTYHCMLY